MHVQPHRIIHYTATGAISGAASMAIGSALLRPADHHYNVGAATLAGFVGGAVTHVAVGLVAAFAPSQSLRREVAHVGASGALSCLTSGLVGAAILAGAGHTDQPGPGHAVLAGGLGGIVLGVAAAAVGTALCCCGWCLWGAQKTNELAERLVEDVESQPDLGETA